MQRSSNSSDIRISTMQTFASRSSNAIRPSTAAAARTHGAVVVSSTIDMVITSSWGDPALVGLTSISGLDENFSEVVLPAPQVMLLHRDGLGAVVNRVIKVYGVSQALVDGEHLTCDPAHMTSIPLPANTAVMFRFSLTEPITLRGLRVWNYNAALEGSCRGAKHVEVVVDMTLRSPVVLRKAPGEDKFEYGQFVLLTDDSKLNVVKSKLPQSKETGLVRIKSSSYLLEGCNSHSSLPVSSTDVDSRNGPVAAAHSRSRSDKAPPVIARFDTENNPFMEDFVDTCSTVMVNQQYETSVRKRIICSSAC